MTKLSQLGPSITGKRHCKQVEHEGDHFYPCTTCGQPVDARDLRQVIWDDQPGHEPLKLDS